MTLAHDLGKKAENITSTNLRNSGYILLQRNYRYLKAEVDLIVQKENTLVNPRVKARSIDFLLPQRSLFPPKNQINGYCC